MGSKKVVILHSGGLDSTLMYELAREEEYDVTAVYFDLGHEYAQKEKQALPPFVEVIDVSQLQAKGVGKAGNGMNNIFIPGRNMLLATMAAAKYVPDEIQLGALPGEIHDQATDKNEKFRNLYNQCLTYVMSPFGDVELHYPFVERDMNKIDITRQGVDRGFSSLILNSSSCMSGEKGACGRCGVCIRRAGIFQQLGLEEKYNVDPQTAPENRKLIFDIIKAEIENDDSHYDHNRRDELIPYLKLAFGDSMFPLQSALEYYKDVK